MKVYKFGGASVRNADGVRNLRKIIDDEQNLFIIVSAMGKTTNALEKVFEGVQKGDKDLSLENVAALREYHAGIINDLWHGPKKLEKVDALFDELERVAVGTVYKPGDAELWYDTIVAFGELVSTTIISEYLNYAGVANRWIDMRRCFLTEQRHKDAGVDLEASEPLLKNALAECVENIFIGQGFIGGAPDGTTTTLGREGSDYSAAVVANILDAESMSVWKDVDGVLNADPKIFPDAEQIAGDPEFADFFEAAAAGMAGKEAQTVANLLVNEMIAYLKGAGVSLAESGIAPAQVAALAKLLATDAISSNQAHEVFEAMAQTGDDPNKIVDERGMRQVSDAGALQPIVDEVLANCADQAQQYRDGNQKVIGFLVGQCMKASRGKGNPKLFNELLRTSLS